jgi:uncharacterized cupredoxin-like copper-binding protein
MKLQASRRAAIVPLIGLLALVGPACGGGGDKTVKASEKDFSITLDKSSVDNGEISFEVSNAGPSTHEFVVFKSDLPDGDLPLDSSTGQVDEAGAGVTHIDEQENITTGSTTTLKVTLDAGKYVLLCNLPGHYQQGMHVSLTVN